MADIPTDPNDPRLAAMPEAGHDPGDPLKPEIEEEYNTPPPPIGDPEEDMEVTGENEVDRDDPSDDLESELSDLDDRQFEEFDAGAIAIEEERPVVAVDEENVALLGKHKRKRLEGEDGVSRKEKKEKRREKTKKSRGRKGEDDDDDPMPDGETLSGKRSRRRKEGAGGERAPRAAASAVQPDEDDESLTPEERRRRALDRAMDAALRKGPKKKKRDGIDLEAQADAEIDTMRQRMTAAAMADTEARQRGEPATSKLRLLPHVMALLNRSNLAQNICDPDTNLLEAIRFFLEPLNDGSLPAFNIQRDLFGALTRLPIHKEALNASGIGKVVVFYTKSKQPQLQIKRMAERLVTDWMRLVLQRSDDYRKRDVESREYDPTSLPIRSTQNTPRDANVIAREKALAHPARSQYTLAPTSTVAYTVAPRSNANAIRPSVRAPGQGGADAFRKLKLRKEGKGSKA